MKSQEDWIERVLVESRPTPAPHWERQLERSLVDSRALQKPLIRPLLAGAALSGTLAAGMLAAGVLGGGPLSPSGSEPVQATPNCRWVETKRIEHVRRVVVQSDGTPRVVTERKPVTRKIKRCR